MSHLSVSPTQNNQLTGEPALWAALVSSGVQFVAAFFLPLSNTQVSVINAVVIAAAGLYVAFTTVSIDRGGSIKAAILGVLQALVSLGAGFGYDLAPEQTVALMSFVGFVSAVFIRQTSIPRSQAHLDLAA